MNYRHQQHLLLEHHCMMICSSLIKIVIKPHKQASFFFYEWAVDWSPDVVIREKSLNRLNISFAAALQHATKPWSLIKNRRITIWEPKNHFIWHHIRDWGVLLPKVRWASKAPRIRVSMHLQTDGSRLVYSRTAIEIFGPRTHNLDTARHDVT